MWWRKGKGDGGDSDPALGEPSPTTDARETVDVGEPVRRVASGGIGDVPLAFAGRVYYVTDGTTGDAIAGWPPKLAGRGFRKPASSSRLRTRANEAGVAEEPDAKEAADATVRRFPPTLSRADTPASTPAASTPRPAEPDDDDGEGDFVFPRSHRRRDLGSSAYFLTEDLAWRWRDAVRRPLGLWRFPRRRLFRPSDVPLGPCGVASMPMGDAYRRLCAGWGNPVLAAQAGVACEESQKTLAAELVGLAMREAGDRTDPLEVKGRNGRIVGEGIARNMVGLLTGYLAEGDEKFVGADSSSASASKSEDRPMRSGTWAADAIASFVADLRRLADKESEESRGGDGDGTARVSLNVTVPGGAGPDGSIATWRRVASQLAASTRGRVSSGDVSGTRRSAEDVDGGDDSDRGGHDGGTEREGAESGGVNLKTPGGFAEEPRIEDATAAEYDLLLTAYAQREDLGGWVADDSYPVDKPVFSSPHVHVRVNREAAGGEDGAEVDGKPRADTYRPWFFDMEDLNRILRRAVAIEARKAAEANAARRATLRRLMALTVTALSNTKSNQKLGAFAIPGLSGKGGGKQGGVGGGGGGGGLIGDAKDDLGDVPADEDDEEEDMMEGLDDDEDESLNDDELMREYMREMVKDGTAEEVLGAWAQSVSQQQANGAGGKRGKSGSNDEKQEVNVGPVAHFAMVHGFTLYFGLSCAWWNFANAMDNFLCDKGGWVGHFLVVQNTPFADMMQSVEVGTFEGICAASLAASAARDVGQRIVAGSRARERRLGAHADGLKATDARLARASEALEAHEALAVRTRAYLNEMHARNAQAAREAAEDAAGRRPRGRFGRKTNRRGGGSRTGADPIDGFAPDMLPPPNLRTEADFARLEQELTAMREELAALTKDRDERRARLLRAVQEDIESTVADTFESARFAEGLRAAAGRVTGGAPVRVETSVERDGSMANGASHALVLTGGPARAAAVLDTPPLFVASLGDDARGMLGTTFGGPAGWLKDAESSSYVIKA